MSSISFLFSYDVRKGKAGRHWWDEQRFDKRVRFLLPSPAGSSSSSHVSRSAGIHQTSSTGLLPARLQIAGVTRQDAGDYRCRIDFNSAPSRNFKYRLVVIGRKSEWELFLISRTYTPEIPWQCCGRAVAILRSLHRWKGSLMMWSNPPPLCKMWWDPPLEPNGYTVRG